MAAVEEPAEPAGPAPGSAHLPEISMDKRVDLALALAIVAVGALAIWIATGFRIGNYPDPLTSRGLPYILGGFMILGGGVLALRRMRGWNDLPGALVVSEGTDDEPGHPASSLRTFAVMGCAFAWAFLLLPAGFRSSRRSRSAGCCWRWACAPSRGWCCFRSGSPCSPGWSSRRR